MRTVKEAHARGDLVDRGTAVQSGTDKAGTAPPERGAGLAARLLTRYAPLWPVAGWLLFGIGAAYCIAAVAGLAGWPAGADGIVAGDAWNYWAGTPYTSEHYRYSPAFYVLTWPLRALPFEVFVAGWTALHLLALAWLGPWTILLAFDDVIRGNVNTFLAVALVVAVRSRQPGAWTAPLLTKVTPGVGLLYHVARREWRAAGVALGVTAAIVALTWPTGLWPDWIGALAAGTHNYGTIDFGAPLPVRLALGALLCLAAGRWIWLLPLGMLVAVPGLLPSSFALLAALPRLVRR